MTSEPGKAGSAESAGWLISSGHFPTLALVGSSERPTSQRTRRIELAGTSLPYTTRS
jgi:hypothetical protein